MSNGNGRPIGDNKHSQHKSDVRAAAEEALQQHRLMQDQRSQKKKQQQQQHHQHQQQQQHHQHVAGSNNFNQSNNIPPQNHQQQPQQPIQHTSAKHPQQHQHRQHPVPSSTPVERNGNANGHGPPRHNGNQNQKYKPQHITVPPNLTPESADVTPPQLMALACEQLDWWRIMTLARQHGPAVTTVHAGEERLTPLHHAALNGKKEYAFQLAMRCAAPHNAVDVFGDTPLIAAVQNCNHAIVRMLVQDAKADVCVVGRFGLTALHWCSEIEADLEAAGCAELLLAHGADPIAEDEAGKSPLHWAALAGKTQLCALLLIRGAMACIDTRDAAGRTPLFNAADKGHEPIVALFAQRAADPTITDVNGISPYEAARRAGHSNICKLLKKSRHVKHSGPATPADRRANERQRSADGLSKNFVVANASNGFAVADTAALGTGGLANQGTGSANSVSSWDDMGSVRSKSSGGKSSGRSAHAASGGGKKSSSSGAKCAVQ
jgi:ankyrin repeat protein